jgi:hypothetical protein
MYMLRYIIAKPFEWLMRVFYRIHLAIDQNSDWYCLNQSELNIICEEYLADFTDVSIDDYLYRDGSIEFGPGCDCG